KDNLYSLKHSPEQEKLIHILLRSYTGLFTDLASINEDTIAKRLEWTHDELYQQLVGLSKESIIQYIPRRKTPFLTFIREREATDRLILNKETYDNRRDRYTTRVKSVLNYAQEENLCRSQMLLSYFGEKETKPCGKCDVCLKKKEKQVSSDEFEIIRQSIQQVLSIEELTLNVLVKKIPFKEPKVIEAIRFMMDNSQLEETKHLKLRLKSSF
ncbi:MAG: RecQ family zinc-binding domain-containing protein, partial [Opitutaceae bacterium]